MRLLIATTRTARIAAPFRDLIESQVFFTLSRFGSAVAQVKVDPVGETGCRVRVRIPGTSGVDILQEGPDMREAICRSIARAASAVGRTLAYRVVANGADTPHAPPHKDNNS